MSNLSLGNGARFGVLVVKAIEQSCNQAISGMRGSVLIRGVNKCMELLLEEASAWLLQFQLIGLLPAFQDQVALPSPCKSFKEVVFADDQCSHFAMGW